jgi:hypothetical protein
MLEFSVSAGIPQLDLGIVPSHKITIAAGSAIYTFWYVRKSLECRDFNKASDLALIELMYSKGIEMDIGAFESFGIDIEKNYHLTRVDSHTFIVTSLR